MRRISIFNTNDGADPFAAFFTVNNEPYPKGSPDYKTAMPSWGTSPQEAVSKFIRKVVGISYE